MAKVKKSATRSVYIASTPPYLGAMTVWALRDFVRTLDAEGVPDDARLTAQHAPVTRHLTGISVRHAVDIESADPAPEETTREH